jgi:hypothetical protein
MVEIDFLMQCISFSNLLYARLLRNKGYINNKATLQRNKQVGNQDAGCLLGKHKSMAI